jgi:hypothetical protein
MIVTVFFVINCVFAPLIFCPQYVYATWVIRRQALADPPIFKPESRTFVQTWHILVTVLLWASITEKYTDTGKAIRDFVTNLFTFP